MKAKWTNGEKRLFAKLSTPAKIQAYLDRLSYNVENFTRSVRGVIREQQAHCFDGAFFAVAALEQLGDPPLLVDLRSNGKDSDHLLAIFRRNGLWGAVAKSNFTGNRYRDPVFRTVRELVMSYFNIYFNLAGEKTLREYSVPIDMRRVRQLDWRTGTENLDPLSDWVNNARHYFLIPESSVRYLADADPRLFKGETLGLDPRGAFKVKNSRLG